jgi:hypothetical protein
MKWPEWMVSFSLFDDCITFLRWAITAEAIVLHIESAANIVP